jgi:Fis family transcriptional regulator, factor for inversion stimulation protein
MKDQLEELVRQMYGSGILYSEGIKEFKKRFILNVLQQCRGNQCKAARELGMHRNTLARTMAELKLDFKHCKPGYQRMEKRRAQSAPAPQAGQQSGAIA